MTREFALRDVSIRNRTKPFLVWRQKAFVAIALVAIVGICIYALTDGRRHLAARQMRTAGAEISWDVQDLGDRWLATNAGWIAPRWITELTGEWWWSNYLTCYWSAKTDPIKQFKSLEVFRQQLGCLNFSGINAESGLIDKLPSLPELQYLSFHQTKVDGDKLVSRVNDFPRLQWLELDKTTGVSASNLSQILTQHPGLIVIVNDRGYLSAEDATALRMRSSRIRVDQR
jgi:hypothetical protein